MPPLRGLDLRSCVFLQRYHPYGIQERFEGSKVSDQSPVRLGMHVAFGRVRRKTEPTGPGAQAVIFSKIDTYGAVSNHTYRLLFIVTLRIKETFFVFCNRMRLL